MNFDKLDTGTFMQYLPGMDFPAEKEEVASTAESNNAPQDMVWRIRNARELNVTTIPITCWRPCGDGASFRNILGRQ